MPEVINVIKKIKPYNGKSFILKKNNKKLWGCKNICNQLMYSINKNRIVCFVGPTLSGKTEVISHLFGRNTMKVGIENSKYNTLYFKNGYYEFSLDNLRSALAEYYYYKSNHMEYCNEYINLNDKNIISNIKKNPEIYINTLLSYLKNKKWILIIDDAEKLLDENKCILDNETKKLIETIGKEYNNIKIVIITQICPILPDVVDIQKRIITMDCQLSLKEAQKYLKKQLQDHTNRSDWKDITYNIVVSNGITPIPALLEVIVTFIINDSSKMNLGNDSLKKICEDSLSKSFDELFNNLTTSEKEVLTIFAYFNELVQLTDGVDFNIPCFNSTLDILCSKKLIKSEEFSRGRIYYRIWPPIKKYIRKKISFKNNKYYESKIADYYCFFDSISPLTYIKELRKCEHMINANRIEDSISCLQKLDNQFIYPFCQYNEGINLREKLRMKLKSLSKGNHNVRNQILNLLSMAKYYRLMNDAEIARNIAKSAEKLALEVNDDNIFKEIYFERSLIEYKYGDFTKGMKYVNLVKVKGLDDDLTVKALGILAVGYDRIGKVEESSKCFGEAIKLLNNNINISDEIKNRLLFQYGISEHAKGNISHSINILEDVYNQTKGKNLHGDVCCCLAISKIDEGDFKVARKHLSEAYSEAIERKKYKLKGRCLSAWGMYHYKNKEYKKASEEYISALNTIEKTNDYEGYVIWNIRLGITYILMGNKSEAQKCFYTATYNIPKHLSISEPDHAITRIYYSLGVCLLNCLTENTESKNYSIIDELVELKASVVSMGENLRSLYSIMNYVNDIKCKYSNERLDKYQNIIYELIQ